MPAERTGVLTATPPASAAREAALVRVAAALSFAAALIHASVIASHFREYWLFGAFFVVAAVLQLAWAGALWAGRSDRRLLAAGALGNLGVAAVWLLSRTAGLPLGPEAGVAEEVGIHDVIATLDELALAVAIGLALYAQRVGTQGPRWLVPPLWALAAVSSIAAFLGDHGAA